ncbi:MAG: hypothetical protein KAG97_09905 [Victivallales bacterium]|nr:hypothetical protein [Victivallales bacterium]
MKSDSIFNKPSIQILFGAVLWASAVACVVFGTKSLIGFDAYYHIEISKLMMERGFVVREFPWTTCSIWSDPFFDKEWLFHVSLTPFIALLGRFDGARTAVVCFAAVAAVSWGWFLSSLGVKRLFFALLLILFCAGYAFPARLVLCRSLLFSIIFLPLAMSLMVRRGRWSLMVVACIYMLSYVGAWQIIPIALIFDGARLLKCGRGSADDASQSFAKEHSESDSRQRSLVKLLLESSTFWAAAGIAAGLLLSPYFPINLKAIYLQSVLVLTAKWFGAGGGAHVTQANELSSIGSKHILAYLPMFAGFAVMYWQLLKKVGWRNLRPETLATTVLATIYFAATLSSQRFVEYLAPVFGVAAVLFWSEHPFRPWNTNCLFYKPTCSTDKTLGIFRLRASALALFVVGFFCTAALARSVRKNHMLFEDSAEWIAANVKPDTLVFSGGWGENSVLFYHLPKYRFLVMLEPYFMYAKSPRKYLLWRKISEGKVLDVSGAVRDTFKTNVIFVPPSNLRLKYSLLSDDFVELVHEGESGESIFIIQ